MAFVMGPLPAIVVAVTTSLICSFYSADAIYFAILGVFVAIRSASYIQNEKSKAIHLICLIGDLALISGVVETIFQWLLVGQPMLPYVIENARLLSGDNERLFFLSSMMIVMALNIVDKGISVIIALAIYMIMPEVVRKHLWNSKWRQKALTKEDIKAIRLNAKKRAGSLRVKVTLLLVSLVVVLTFILGLVSARINYQSIKSDGKEMVADVARYAASFFNTNDFEKFLEDGSKISEYSNIKYMQYNTQLLSFKQIFSEVEYLYVYQIREDGCYTLFDTDKETQKTGYVGDKIDFDEMYLPLVPDLLLGKKIPVQEVDSRFGIFITAYEPITDPDGNPTNYYVGADIAIENYDQYIRRYILRLGLAFSGFFAMILAYGLYTSAYHLVYPMSCLERSIDDIITNMDDQDKLDDSVRNLESLDIRTGDEVETLYRASCEMANQSAEQIRSIRLLARSNEKMQTGLIMTMADIFENQEIDSRAHIQKTAEYVRIILEGLRKKGYYTEKLTDKFINDVEISAPLYDIGKVKIPSSILNKPGELTDEEEKIMETHTTEGKKILENAISTVEGENYLKEARNMAAYHHENWDGTGYPLGLHGEVIPLSARIMAIADIFDELTSTRVYRNAQTAAEALEELKKGAGTRFDPKCVEVFEDSFAEVKSVLRKYPGS
jgi:response regulator RpfG family c-di-GMP phosphodiesterase